MSMLVIEDGKSQSSSGSGGSGGSSIDVSKLYSVLVQHNFHNEEGSMNTELFALREYYATLEMYENLSMEMNNRGAATGLVEYNRFGFNESFVVSADYMIEIDQAVFNTQAIIALNGHSSWGDKDYIGLQLNGDVVNKIHAYLDDGNDEQLFDIVDSNGSPVTFSLGEWFNLKIRWNSDSTIDIYVNDIFQTQVINRTEGNYGNVAVGAMNFGSNPHGSSGTVRVKNFMLLTKVKEMSL